MDIQENKTIEKTIERTYINMGDINVGGKTVNISGGIMINVRVETTGVTWDELHEALGCASSPRVKIQSRLRMESTEVLTRWAKTGYEIKFRDLNIRAANRPKTVIVVKTLKDAMAAYADIGEFLTACENAGWLEMTSSDNLTKLHTEFHKV